MIKKLLLRLTGLLLLVLLVHNSAWATNWCADATIEGGYLFNEASGDAQDCSTNDRDGTVTNITYGATGQFGDAYLWPSNDGRVDLGTGFPNLTDMTFVCWINMTNIANGDMIFDTSNSAFGFSFWFDGTTGLKWQRINDASATAARRSDSGVVSTGSLQHLGFTSDGDISDVTGTKFFVDGVEVTYNLETNQTNTPKDLSANNMFLGNTPNLSWDYDGIMDEPAFFSDEKSSTDVNDIMDNGLFEVVAAAGQVIMISQLPQEN